MAHSVAILNGKEPSGGSGGVSDADFSHLAINFFSAGVVQPTHYLVEEQETPDMTVKVGTGKAYVPNSDDSMLYSTELDASDNVTITANSSGNPRIDAIVITIDLEETPDETASNVATLVAVPGTAASSPNAPDDSDIQTEVGAGNPFYRLANVAVANSASSITDADVTDTRELATLQPRPVAAATASDGATVTFDLREAAIHTVTLGGNRTLALSNVAVNRCFVLRLVQDGTGSRTVTWFSGIKWPDNTVPTLTTTASKTDVFGFICTSTGNYDGFLVGQNL